MATLNDLADLLFPDVKKSIADLEKNIRLVRCPPERK
jgi:hypothetical protein